MKFAAYELIFIVIKRINFDYYRCKNGGNMVKKTLSLGLNLKILRCPCGVALHGRRNIFEFSFLPNKLEVESKLYEILQVIHSDKSTATSLIHFYSIKPLLN